MPQTMRSVRARLRMKHSLDLRLLPSSFAQMRMLPIIPTKLMALKQVSLTTRRESDDDVLFVSAPCWPVVLGKMSVNNGKDLVELFSIAQAEVWVLSLHSTNGAEEI